MTDNPLRRRVRASELRIRLGTLGPLRIPYGVPHGSIVAHAQDRLRALHWPTTMATLRDALERNR